MASYSYKGQNYDNYTDWVAAQTGATAAQVAQAQAQAGNNHAGVLAALNGHNQTGAGIVAQGAIQDALANQYANWQNVQSDPSALLYGTSFQEALDKNGGMEQVYQTLNSLGTKGINQGLTDAQVSGMIQQVSGGNTQGAAGGYSDAYKAVYGGDTTNAPAAGTAAKPAATAPQQSTYTTAAPSATGTTANQATGSGSSSSSATDQSRLIEELYAAQREAELAALKKAYDENVLSIDAAAAKIPAQYQAARNSAASDAAVQQRNFNQYAAASGLNSGTSAQGQLAIGNTLQSGLSSMHQAEADALSELELQRAQLHAQYQNSVAQAIAQGDVEKAKALYAEAVRLDEALMSSAYQQAQLAYQQSTLDRALANDEWNRAYQQAQLLAGLEDYEGAYRALGLTAPATYTTPVTGKGGPYTVDNTLTPTIDDGVVGGISPDTTYPWGGAKVDERGFLTVTTPLTQLLQQGNTAADGGAGLNEARFRAAMTSLTTRLQQGNTAAALQGIDSIYSQLSSAQRAQLEALLNQYGISYVL